MPFIEPSRSLVDLLILYSHEDRRYLRDFRAHLRVLEREGRITVTCDEDLAPGGIWEKELFEHLDRAEIIVPLITAHFLNSEYCYQREMPYFLARVARGERVLVLPIIVQPCRWRESPLDALNVLPRFGMPVTDRTWHSRDKAWDAVVREISDQATKFLGGRNERVVISQPLDMPPSPAVTLDVPDGTVPPLNASFTENTSDRQVADAKQLLGPEARVVDTDEVHVSSNPEVNMNRHVGLEGAKAELFQLLEDLQSSAIETERRPKVLKVVDLASECLDTHPELVARVFTVVDEDLKSLGDKRRVLKVADLALKAVGELRQHLAPAHLSDEYFRYEAHAYICGLTWVYQRRDRLDDALATVKHGQDIARAISDAEALAHAAKAKGRIHRLLAENAQGEERQRMFRQSERDLQDAIALFPQIYREGNPERNRQVGDCFSLLGRTYLSAMRSSLDIDEAILEASRHLAPGANKPYIDLCILQGDVAITRHEYERARKHYEEALALLRFDGLIDSEMAGRTYHGLARYWEAKQQRKNAAQMFRQEADIYARLHEGELSARAEWEAALREDRVPRWMPDLVRDERYAVKRDALSIYLADQARYDRSSVSRPIRYRAEPSQPMKNEILHRARHKALQEQED